MNRDQREAFIDTVWDYYNHFGRHDLAWRKGVDQTDYAYKVLVSEIMLQQTQVQRVSEKFEQWIKKFPTLESVAGATLADCIVQWSGLGYNRRAKYLYDICRRIALDYRGIVPDDTDVLAGFTGIGENTVGAIVAYSYNRPTVFIETNIRTVYIHHFFPENSTLVHDSEILPLIAATVDVEHPRDWYWALMDYGTYIKKTIGNKTKHSAHYAKQTKFDGSLRQVRGHVLRCLRAGSMPLTELQKQINDERLLTVLSTLEQEGMIEKTGVEFRLYSKTSDII